MPDPPDKFTAFSTEGMKSPNELAAKLSVLYDQGYTGQPVVVPVEDGNTWVAVGGYIK